MGWACLFPKEENSVGLGEGEARTGGGLERGPARGGRGRGAFRARPFLLPWHRPTAGWECGAHEASLFGTISLQWGAGGQMS